MKILVQLIILLVALQHSTLAERQTADVDVSEFLNQINPRLAELYNKEVLANWQNEIKGPNDIIALLQSEIATQEIMRFVQSITSKVSKYKRLNIAAESLKRQLAQVPYIGYEVLGHDDLELMYAVTTNMSEIYRNSKLCAYKAPDVCDLSLIPDVQNILHKSKDVHEIEYYWLEWRRKTGVAARTDFQIFVQLYRKTAKLNGFAKASDFWYKDLEENSTEAIDLLDKFMMELRPLFVQFHGRVRATLRTRYGPELVPLGKPYPQHLAEIYIGNAYRKATPDWYRQLPYPDVIMTNITEGLLRRGLNNPQRIFWNVADYFRSTGLPQLEEDFWSLNVMPKAETDEDELTCWHKAWKYYGRHDVNFTYCQEVDEERFFNMIEALSDVYYYRAYIEQPTLLQEEPFPNFSDALGKFFSLAASSPKYLEKLKVLGKESMSKEARINRLYTQGLRTIFLLPVFYILDRYRVEVLDDKIHVANNCAYWQLTEVYTGAEPPVTRTNADFDAPAKLLMEIDEQYTSQIMSIVLQYQLYKHFCELTGQYEKGNPDLPLDLCDLSNSRLVGPFIWKAMSLGSSKSYKEILYMMTNTTELSMQGLLEYFQPLYDWLAEANQRELVEIGWATSKRCVA